MKLAVPKEIKETDSLSRTVRATYPIRKEIQAIPMFSFYVLSDIDPIVDADRWNKRVGDRKRGFRDDGGGRAGVGEHDAEKPRKTTRWIEWKNVFAKTVLARN